MVDSPAGIWYHSFSALWNILCKQGNMNTFQVSMLNLQMLVGGLRVFVTESAICANNCNYLIGTEFLLKSSAHKKRYQGVTLILPWPKLESWMITSILFSHTTHPVKIIYFKNCKTLTNNDLAICLVVTDGGVGYFRLIFQK